MGASTEYREKPELTTEDTEDAEGETGNTQRSALSSQPAGACWRRMHAELGTGLATDNSWRL